MTQIILFFLLDSFIFYLLKQKLFSLLFARYIILLCRRPLSYAALVINANFFMIFSFISHNKLGIDLIYIMPTTALAICINYFLHYRFWQPYALGLISFFIHMAAINTLSNVPSHFSFSYTLIKICAILLVILLMSLIYEKDRKDGT